MERTQFKQLLHNIKESIVSFISICVFIILSIALFIGLGWGSNAVKDTANADFQKFKLHDYDISLFVGADQSDVDEFKTRLTYIDEAEGTYRTCESFYYHGVKNLAQICSITSKVDQLFDIEGELPSGVNEIAVERTWGNANHVAIGETIQISADEVGRGIAGYYFNAPVVDGHYNFVVTALVSSVAYISSNSLTYGSSKVERAPINAIMFVNPTSCNHQTFNGFTNVLLRSNYFNNYSYYSPEYINNVTKYQDLVDYVATDIAWRRPCEEQILIRFITTNRNQCPSVASVNLSVEGSKNLRFSLSISLTIIALLICYTVVTRLSTSQAKEIGTKKALGFTNGEISKSFLLYTGFASILGIIGGVLVGKFIIEPVAFSQMKNNFLFHSRVLSAEAISPIVMGIIILVFIGIVTLLSVLRMLRKDSLTLLDDNINGKGKKHAYEKLRIWKKTPLLTKTIINNFVNEKKRVISTIIGIVGVTTLLTCGFTFSSNLSIAGELQFSQYQNFDCVVYYDSYVTGCEQTLLTYIQEEKLDYAPALSTSGIVASINNGGVCSVNVFVSGDDESFEKMYNFISTSGEKLKFENSLFLGEGVAKAANIKIGDTFTYLDLSEGPCLATVNGIVKCYSGAPCFVSREYYEDYYMTPYQGNSFIINTKGKDLTNFYNKVKNVNGYITTDLYKDKAMHSLKQVSGSFVAIVIMYIFMSIMMAFLVILNLLVTGVANKKREILTLMVNGYSLADAKRYIYVDTIFLSIISIILGGIFGTLVGDIAIRAVCVGTAIFPMGISWISILISVIGTAILVAVVSLISLRKINKFELTNINS